MRPSLGLVAASIAAASCGPAGPAALRVRVLVDSRVAARCIVLRLNGGGAGELRQVRGTGAVEPVFTIEQDQRPDRIFVAAGAGVGDGCTDPLVFSARTQSLEGAFASPPGLALLLHLSPPSPDDDGDGDGFAGAAGGGDPVDCDDGDPRVHPGALEACLDGVDADCDGLVGCADPDCAAAPCAPAATRLAFASEPQALAAGECSAPVILRALNASGAVAGLPRELPVPLSVSPQDSLRFFADGACAVPLAEAYVGPGTLSARLHVRGVTGGVGVLLAAATGLQPASQSFTIRPMVMSGTCVLANYTNRVSCPVPASFDPRHSLLVFQAATSDDTPSSTDVVCSIASGTAVVCERSGYNRDATIAWRVLQRLELTVQHLVRTAGSPDTVAIAPVAGVASTFLLTSFAVPGTQQGDTDFRYAQLTSPSSVAVRSAAGGSSTLSLQVVEWPGSTVARGVTPAMEGLALDVTGLAPVDLSRTFLTYSFRSSSLSSRICDRSVRGELTSPTSIRFHRGDGNLACQDALVDAIGWERVQLPAGARVQALGMALAAGAGAGTAAIDPVDVTRTLLLAGGQFTGGQAGGEGSYELNDVLGEMHGAFTFTGPSQVRVERASFFGSARWTLFAVEVPP